MLKLEIFRRDTHSTKELKKTFLLHFQGQIVMARSGIELY